MSDIPLDELREQRTALSTRLDETIADIVAVIASDVPAFVARAARQVFVAQPLEHARKLGPDEVRRLKTKLNDAAPRIAALVTDTLADRTLWRRDDLEPGADLKSLEHNAPLWHAVQEIARQTEALLAELGLEPPVDQSAFGLVYRTPTWFLDGKYPPALVEKYWTLQTQLRDLDQRIAEEAEKQEREALARRWDEA